MRLLPARDFRRYAVATRMPRGLLRRLPTGVCRATDWPGVHDLVLGITPIRLIVINALEEHPRNAPWEIFAGELARSRYGLTHFQPRGALGQLLQHHLINAYRLEVPDMAYTVDDFMRDTLDLIARDLAALTPELRAAALAQVDVEERLHGLTAEERLRGLDPELVKEWLKRSDH